MKAQDINGNEVNVGDRVQVLSIRDSVLTRLEEEEKKRITEMAGLVLVVYEIDDWGGVWVRNDWDTGNGTSTSHSLLLSPKEMQKIIA